MISRVMEITVSVLIVVFVIYLLKVVFIKNVRVPVLTPILEEI